MPRGQAKKPSPLECLARKLSSNQIKNVVTIAGAGISTSAGIPDWRSPDIGLSYNLKKYSMQYADVMFGKYHFLNNPDVIYSVLRDHFIFNPLKPTLTHCFIKLLEVKGVLLRHFTQNIDGMELMTGIRPEKVVEAHGTLQRSYCIACKAQYTYEWLIKNIEDNPVPKCESCVGLVRPDIVLLGEKLSPNFHLRKFVDMPECDLLIILGTSLQVEPFASLVMEAPLDCPRLVIDRSALGNVNPKKTPQDSKNRAGEWERGGRETGNELIVSADCDLTVLELVKSIGWEGDFRKVIRDVKLRKLYGSVLRVDVAVQTLPLSGEREYSFVTTDCPIRSHRCSDCRDDPNKKRISSGRFKPKLQTHLVKPIINVEPQMKSKRGRSKLKPNIPTANVPTIRRICDTCYSADCSPRHEYIYYRK